MNCVRYIPTQVKSIIFVVSRVQVKRLRTPDYLTVLFTFVNFILGDEFYYQGHNPGKGSFLN